MPSLLSDNVDEIITYMLDNAFFRYLDPLISQKTNMFFSRSTMEITTHVWDIFESNMVSKDFFEKTLRENSWERSLNNFDVAERKYFEIYLR